MSIVAVHGPHTFGSKAVTEAGPAMAVVDPTNGLKWDFKLDGTTTRSNQDFSWAFPTDGTPTPQVLADPTVVTYATPGTKTATLTVTNTAKATINNKALANNVATLTFSAAHGFTPGQRINISGGTIGAPFVGGPYTLLTAAGSTVTFALTAADVTSVATTGTATSASDQYPPAGSYPIVVTAVSGVAPMMMGMPGNGEEPPPAAYDPGDYTVAEVQQYVTENPDQVEEVYEAEMNGKARTTLLTWLESFTA